MSAPPIINPPAVPPLVPPLVDEQSLQKYVVRCKVICIVAASLFLIGISGALVHYLEHDSLNWSAFGFGVWCVVMGYLAAWLLHRRRSEAYLAASIHPELLHARSSADEIKKNFAKIRRAGSVLVEAVSLPSWGENEYRPIKEEGK